MHQVLAESRRALEAHRVAKASGNERATAAARQELERVKRVLERAKADAVTLALAKQALRSPRRVGW